ncbi:unnamed protein product [Caenorhabditis sp. 36 PRJEB53466]|nr:unnamed protein product [Caenorhabditis sp. 36 PRJEB53466]
MRDPVCSDKRDIHAAFCREAMQLLQVVTGKKMHAHQAKDLNLNHGALSLIHDHLEKKGLSSVAAMLKTEAKLPDKPASRTTVAPLKLRPFPSTGNNFIKIEDAYPTLAPRMLESEIGGISGRRPSNPAALCSPMISRSISNDEDNTEAVDSRGSWQSAPPVRNNDSQRPGNGGAIRPVRDLDSIAVEYFKTQHSSCKNPVTTCPPLSLYYPHPCPERTQKTSVMQNMAYRFFNYEILRPNCTGSIWTLASTRATQTAKRVPLRTSNRLR